MPRRATMQENETNATENMPQQVPLEVTITELDPERAVLANADVKIGDMMTIRNVKIKQDDYGLVITMPRTKMSNTGQYKDSVFFADKSMKERFDQAVESAYHDYIQQHDYMEESMEEDMEQEESAGMNMGM